MGTSKENTSIKFAGFGSFKGVYLPSVLTIFGVIMYLRLGWILGNVGLFETLLIVTLATSITLLTGLSISAIATNMQVGGGGAYYMISRSFGIEAGAAVGISLFLAQTIGISFYISGFSESVQGFFPHIAPVYISIVSLIIITFLALVSADIALKTQFLIFLVIIASLISLFLGGTPEGGFIETNTPLENTVSFWPVFAVFFPAVTGIEAGISMSGDLKNPAKSLPLGTILAILSGYVVYMAIPIFLNSFVPREVLLNNTMICRDVAMIRQLILVGIWGATLSSALGAILGAPRTLQALARDRIMPTFLGLGFGKEDTPRIATATSFLIALLGLILGDLDTIAPILSMFFLTSYGTLNTIAALEGLIGNPSWRPTLKISWTISFAGSMLCLMAMFMINPGATFISIAIIGLIFAIMVKRQLNSRWSDIRRSLYLMLARFSIYSLADSESDARTWRPNVLVLSGPPIQRMYLIELADALTHGKGFMTVTSIIGENNLAEQRKIDFEKSIRNYLKERKIPALVDVQTASKVHNGMKNVINTYGLGSLVPNTVILGVSEERGDLESFADVIKFIYASKKNLIIVREGNLKKAPILHANKRIDCWLGGQRDNAGLMLTLGFLLQTSPEWRGSELSINSLVRKEEERESSLARLHEFLKGARLAATPKVLVADTEKGFIEGTIHNFSLQSDLVFLGMKPPDEGETVDQYTEYYKNLLLKTEDFPMLVFVLSAEKISFREIFN